MWITFEIFHVLDMIPRGVVGFLVFYASFVYANCYVDFVCVFWAWILMSFASEYFFWFKYEGQFKVIYVILLCVCEQW